MEGTVYDFLNRKPLESILVFSTGKNRSITDSMGRYSIPTLLKDSIWFSFLGKNTPKYAVDTMSNVLTFDVALHIDARYLPEVRVRSSNYRMDSLFNRQAYAKIFNFKKPSISLAPNPSYIPGSVSVGLDLNEFINMFRFRRNRQILSLQARLLQQEQEKYINHRFNKRFIIQLTGLSMSALDSFMQYYKPEYEILLQLNDLELGYYIEQCFKHYSSIKNHSLPFRKEEQSVLPPYSGKQPN